MELCGKDNIRTTGRRTLSSVFTKLGKSYGDKLEAVAILDSNSADEALKLHCSTNKDTTSDITSCDRAKSKVQSYNSVLHIRT